MARTDRDKVAACNTPTTRGNDSSGRLIFLDWLRILAFALLVPYHVGMYYVSWDWHVKSAAASPFIELLFFIAGAASQALPSAPSV